jgi:predicted DNA-binding protein
METQSRAKRTTAIRLESEQIGRIQALAVAERRQFSDMVRLLIEDGLSLQAKKDKKQK